MRAQAEAALEEILVEVPTVPLDHETAWRCIRAAYARGYHDMHEHDPYPLTEASDFEREAWALLPAS